jgi:hypothetical protein
MPTSVEVQYIGVACVILALGKMQEKKLVVLLPYKDLDIKNVKNVNCVASKHKILHN